jgi:hypothetical protein
MRERRGQRVAQCVACVWLAACSACNSKTPVPFKRSPTVLAPGAADGGIAPLVTQGDVSMYPEGTQQIRVNDEVIERPGTIRASLVRDLDGDGQAEVLLVTSDAQGQTQLETLAHGSSSPSTQLRLMSSANSASCRLIAADLSVLSSELGKVSIDLLCDTPLTAAAPASTAATAATPNPTGTATNSPKALGNLPAQPVAIPSGATAQAAKLPGSSPALPLTAAPNQASTTPTANAAKPEPSAAELDGPPPEPSAAIAQTHHFVFSLENRPRILLHVAADWNGDSEPVSNELTVTGNDVDGDQHGDVQVALQLKAGGDDAKPIVLTWFNRPSGLARDRAEPEHALSELADTAYRLSEKRPEASAPIANQVLRLHHLLCRESGVAQLFIDEARGVSCGASVAAGKAAVANAVALAHAQQLLPALQARASLDDSSYHIDNKARERVTQAVAAIRGDTSYRWLIGPALRPTTTPNIRLPALGFIDENTLLLRGPIAQSYDLTTRSVTPTGMPGSVLATDATRRFAVIDIQRSCDGYHARIAPANRVIGGLLTGPSLAEPILLPDSSGDDPALCVVSSLRKSDRGGFVLLGLNASGALFAHGASLRILPLDASGQATGPSRVPTSSEPLPPLSAAGALDQTSRHFALATSEGVAIVDRVAQTARLVRTPASCAGGQVSDAVLSPSGQKLAMLCGGHVYVADSAADGGGVERPLSEHP